MGLLDFEDMKTLIVLFVLLTNLLIAETRYVSKTGASMPPYTSWATACDSLQKCFNFCNSGDTVYIDRGVYREVIYVENKDLVIVGVDTDQCIIDGTGLEGSYDKYAMFVVKTSKTTMKNVTLKFPKVDESDNYTAAAFLYGETDILNCIIDSTVRGIGLFNNSIVKNSIFRNLDVAIDIGSLPWMNFKINNNYFYILSNGPNMAVINNMSGDGNYFINNNIFLKDQEDSEQYAIKLTTNERVEIKNNLFSRFKRAISEVSYYTGVYDTTFIINNSFIRSSILAIVSGNTQKECIIKNNIIAYGKWGIYVYDSCQVKGDYNLYYKIWQNPYYQVTPGEHDIIANPMFVNDTIATYNGNYDYHLQKYSPAIDSGDPSILDIDETRSDIGMFGGPGGTKYHYIDYAPRAVTGINCIYNVSVNTVTLNWNSCDVSDFKSYKIYRDISSNFVIDSTKLIAELNEKTYNDVFSKGSQKIYYKITAVDSAGNESIPSAEVNVTITGVNEPDIKLNYNYELYQNYPNPFNPSTTISYSLKEPGEVRVKLYNITGQLLKTIIEGGRDKGYNETKIDLSSYASGIYLYRLEVTGKGKIPAFNDLKKMVYVK